MILSSVTQAGGGAQSNIALYHPWILCQSSWMRGGSPPTSASTSAPASSAHRLQSAARLALMAHPSLLFIACPFAGSRIVETLSLTSLHVSVEIHLFCLASLALASSKTPLLLRMRRPVSLAPSASSVATYSSPLGTDCALSGRRLEGNPAPNKHYEITCTELSKNMKKNDPI